MVEFHLYKDTLRVTTNKMSWRTILYYKEFFLVINGFLVIIIIIKIYFFFILYFPLIFS